jgi:hypothetical protein
MAESLIDVMLEVGLAIYGGGYPYHRIRVAKNAAKLGTSTRRVYETLLKQDLDYLKLAVDKARQQRGKSYGIA